nr:hypothetical protein [Tanacetum cinerariifolium]
MKIPAWMILEAMKHTEHYQMYAKVFGIDVPLTQSQLTESTQGTYRTPSSPRLPNPKMDAIESSAPKRSTVIHFCIPQQRSTRLTPPTSMPTVDNADEMILQMVEGYENVIDDSLISRNDEHNIPGTRLEPRSDKESSEVEFTDVVIPVNVNEEEEEITDEVYELKQREKGKIVENSRNTPFPTPIRSPRIYTDLVSSNTEKLQELTVTDTKYTPSSSSPNTKLSTTNRLLSLFKVKPAHFKRYKSFFQKLQGCYEYLFKHLRARFMPRKSFATLADHIQELQQQDIAIWLALQMKFGILHVPQTTCKTSAVRPRDQDDPHDDAHPEGENSAKQQKTSEYEAYVSRESSSGRDNEKEQGPSTLGIEKHEMFSIIYEPVHGNIYKNNKKEKRVMRHSEIHKFCDATLNQVLKGLKSYNNDVKYGYIQKDLTKDEAGYLKLFKEEIEVRLKYHRQIRRWEMYVNGRPLGPQRERPE